MLRFIILLALIGGIVGLLSSGSGDESRSFWNGAKKGAGCGCSLMLILFLFISVIAVFMLIFMQ